MEVVDAAVRRLWTLYGFDALQMTRRRRRKGRRSGAGGVSSMNTSQAERSFLRREDCAVVIQEESLPLLCCANTTVDCTAQIIKLSCREGQSSACSGFLEVAPECVTLGLA